TYWIYGRYNEGVLLPVLVVALVGIANAAERKNRGRFVASVAAALVLIGALALVLVRFWTPATGPPYSFNASAVSIHSELFGWGILRAAAATGIGLLVLGSLFSYRWRWGVVGLGIFFGLSTLATYRDSWVRRNDVIAGQQELIQRIERIAPEDETIFWDSTGRRHHFNYFNVSYFLPELTYKILTRTIPQPSGELVLSGRSDFSRWYPGARLVGLENLTFRPVSYIQGLWVLPGPLQDTLEARRWLFPKDFPGRLGDDTLKAQLRLVEPSIPPRRIRQDQELFLDLEVDHRGGAPWPHRGGLWTREYSVGLLLRWFPATGEPPAAQTWVNLPRTLYPGESVRRLVPLRAAAAGKPLTVGDYRVTIAIAQVYEQTPRGSEQGALELEIEVVR
ncbi:MAG: hypothetical protein V3T72_19320, partial [Thermoanaerobaculia bacterium]